MTLSPPPAAPPAPSTELDDRVRSLILAIHQRPGDNRALREELVSVLMKAIHLHAEPFVARHASDSHASLDSEADLIAELDDKDSDPTPVSHTARTRKRHHSEDDDRASQGSSPSGDSTPRSANAKITGIEKISCGKLLLSLPMSHSSPMPELCSDEDEEVDEDSTVDHNACAFLTSEFACGLCGLFLHRPVTPIECGHSFCQSCLTAYIDRVNNATPTCPIAGCHAQFTPECSRHVCHQLNSALEKSFPREYAIAKLHSESISAIASGCDDQAVSHLTQALRQWPDAFPLYASRLCCQLRLCNFQSSLIDLHQCVRLARQFAPSSSATPMPQLSPVLSALTALGQAGHVTRIHKLATFAFASALRLSHQRDQRIDREQIAGKLIDAYLGEIAKVEQQQQQQQQLPQSASLTNRSSVSLMPSASASSTQSLMSSSQSLISSTIASQSHSMMRQSMSMSTTSASQSLIPNATATCLPRFPAAPLPPASGQMPTTLQPAASTDPRIQVQPTLEHHLQLSMLFNDMSVTSDRATADSSLPSSSRIRRLDASLTASSSRRLLDRPLSSAVRAEFQCLLCMSMLHEPVTVKCGHSFCNTCLARSLDHKNVCPYCRESLSVHISPLRQPVNIAIKTMLNRWCPANYSKRSSLIASELADQSNFIPIFVCTLMFPGVCCPLHIFEPRYRLMIRQCLESGYNRFGMCVQIDKDGSFSSIGCTAEIKNVQLLPDGRSLIDTVGGRRFMIKEKSCRNGYDVARIEYFDDLTAAEQQEMFGNAQPPLQSLVDDVEHMVNESLMPLLMNLFDIESQLGSMPSINASHALYCYWLCAVLPMRMDEKFEFLQYRSDYERFHRLRQTLVEVTDKEFC